jgi:hypothetical protein
MCLNRDDFIKDLADCKKCEMTIYDEAGDISSRGAMTEFNRQLMVAYQIIRADNICTILVLPDIWDLDSYFRNKRIKGLFYVKERGKVAYFSKKKLERILFINNHRPIKNYFVSNPNFTDSYPIYKGEMKEQYGIFKDKKVREYRKNLVENSAKKVNEMLELENKLILNMHNKGLNNNEIAKVIEKSNVTVGRRLKGMTLKVNT